MKCSAPIIANLAFLCIVIFLQYSFDVVNSLNQQFANTFSNLLFKSTLLMHQFGKTAEGQKR